MQTITFDDRFLAEVNEDGGEFEQDVRLATAIWFYVCHKLTLGQAAEMAGESQYEFMNRLSRCGWSAIDYPAEDLRAEAMTS
jgi:predicted HTH domain antitoxin